MATFPEYEDYDATGLAQLVARKELSATELVEAAIERIESRNRALNAVVHTSFARARARAKAHVPGEGGAFGGVPFLLKDLGAYDEGQPSTSSTKLRQGWRASQDDELVRRFKAAGLIVLGRTNTPEFGILGVTEPELRGPCRNPWNLRHTPGGSSGGSAAAVAARFVPLAHAGDGGGSIRIPASHCGLVGLKPSRGRNPMGPERGEGWLGLVCEHVVARTVRDSAALLDLTCGHDAGAPYAAPKPSGPFAQELGADPGRLRIGYCAEPLFGGELDADIAAGLQTTVADLRALGHEVVEHRPDFDRQPSVRAYLTIVAANVARAVQSASALAEQVPRAGDFEETTWLLKLIADKLSAAEYQGHIDHMRATARSVARSYERFDLLLTPTVARPPVPIGEFALSLAEKAQGRALRAAPLRALMMVALDAMAGRRLQATPNTMLFNLTGQPAVSVPLHHTRGGLPFGMQFVARYGDEATLIRLAAQLERAHPWADRRPPGVS